MVRYELGLYEPGLVGPSVKRAVAAVGVVAAVAGGSIALATERTETRIGGGPADGACREGQAPSSDAYGERPPEGSLRYTTRPVVIGCGQLSSGRRFELVGYRLGGRKRSSLCIDVHYPDSGESSGCGSNRIDAGGAIDATGVTRTAGKPATVTGATRGSVKRVTLRYELGGRMGRERAALVVVRDPDLLRVVKVSKPFGLYLGEVPPRARAVSAQARGTRGNVVGVGYFDGFGGPIGEGRRCHGRPRVSRLRLSTAAWNGKPNTVTFVARYPNGYIGSAEVRTDRTIVHADLVVPKYRRDGGRRNLTLPVRLERRGTVGIDVTVEGLPLAFKRCGADGRPRQSAPKTLVARVR